MGDLVPTPVTVKGKNGTVHQAIRYVRMSEAEQGKKGWKPPQVSAGGSDQLVFANIHHSLSKRGFSDGNISYAIDIAVNRAGVPSVTLTGTKVMTAINDCIDALGDQEYSFADEQTKEIAERVITASLHQLPSNERVRKMVQNPEIDLDKLISLVTEEGVTDPAKLELILEGGAKPLADGAL